MSLVHITTAASPSEPVARKEYDRFLSFYHMDRFGTHRITEDPHRADLILFIEKEEIIGPFLTRSYLHRLARAHRDKTFMVNPRYKRLPLMPGVFASLHRSDHQPGRTRSGHYFEVSSNDTISYSANVMEAPYLYSFIGEAWTHPVRNSVLALNHPQAKVEDTAGIDASVKQSPQYFERYLDICKDSKFILCPRGAGPSSLRLFECLKLGRVPVIIADDWVPPAGPDWEEFSIRIAESAVASIPDRLERRVADALPMAQKARSAWENWFSAEVTFHRTVEYCLDIMEKRPRPESMLRLGLIKHALRPRHARAILRASLPSVVLDKFRRLFLV